MIKIFKPIDEDWMSYKITKKNILTFHHIEEVASGGLTIIQNGVLITKSGHRILHMVSNKDIMLYEA